MYFSSLLTTLALLSTTGWAQYTLEDDYLSGGSFFDLFTFFTSADPTDGTVVYQSESAASSAGLISSSSSNVYMGVDNTTVTPDGRPSVRITSNKSYNAGTLVILDLEHMPYGCGTWPAFWMLGPNWPTDGEIDIIEGVNEQTVNDMTLHTDANCSITNNGEFSGSIVYTSCDSSSSDDNGCQITTDNTETYGTGFNDNNGGVYAMEWTDTAISVFFFARSSIPADITSGVPVPSTWGEPLAMFQGDCDITEHFLDMQIVFDITFCGDWAGAVWSSSSCASSASTCASFVENNPSAFSDAYWSVNALKVYSSISASATAPVSWASSTSSVGSATEVSSTMSTIISAEVTSAAAPSSTDAPYAPFFSGTGPIGEGAAPSTVANAVVDGTSTSASSSTTFTTALTTSSATSTDTPEVPGLAPGESIVEEDMVFARATDVVGEVKERHTRHLERHRRHGARRL